MSATRDCRSIFLVSMLVSTRRPARRRAAAVAQTMLRYSGSGWSPLQDRRFFVEAQEAWGPCDVAHTMQWYTALRGNTLQLSAPALCSKPR